MGTAVAPAIVTVEEYLATTYRPDCDYVDGQVVERNVGKKRHAVVQTKVSFWLGLHATEFDIEVVVEQRLQVAPKRFRIPDVLAVRTPLPEEEVFTSPPYLCVEVMSPDDTMSSLQDRIDDYLHLGVPNLWVIDPWKRRAWTVTATGWHTSLDGFLRTSDGIITMPLAEVLPSE